MGVRAWGPVTNPTGRALASWLCALWGWQEGAQGGRLLPGCGTSGSGALPTPTARPLGGLPGPTTHWLWVRGGAGVGTRHQPHSTRSCMLWGQHEGARGGRLLSGCGASGVGRSPTADCPPSGRAAGAHYPRAVGAGGCGRGDPSPTRQRALLRAGFASGGGGTRAPGGGTSCLGVGRPGSGTLPTPTARPLGGLPGPTTHWLWVRRGAGVGTRHQPHSARSCELALRAVGVARGRPGGAPAAWVWGVRGRALSHPQLPAPWAGCRGPLPTGCGCGGMRAWGPVTNPTARALASWLCALWGRHEGARGGASCLGVGRPGWGALATLTAPSGRAAGAHYPLALGAGGCGRGDPSPTPQRALLRAVFARCGGGTREPGGGSSCLGVGRPGSGALPPPTARPLGGLPGPTTHWLWVRGDAGVGTRHQPHSARSCELALRVVNAARERPGGAPPAWVWGVWGRALFHPRLPALWAGCRGPLPTGCGCGGVRAWGLVTNHTARALACCGGGMRVPGGGASSLGMGRPGSSALPPPTARPLGGLPGPTTHWLWVRGGAGVGTRHQPHSARSCELALRAVGVARGRPGGAPPAWVWGVRGRALAHPRLPALWAACGGPLPTGCGCGGVRAWGPVTNPTARALACCGGSLRVPGGGASCLGVGRPGSGALPPPTARPLGGLPGPTTHRLWVRGGAGVGTRHQPGSARSCELALRVAGAARGHPGGAPPAWVWDVRGRALSQPRLPALWAGCRGPLPTGCGGGGVRAWGPVTNPTARALACCWGSMRVPGGSASCLGVGRPGSGALPPPTARPLGGLPGTTTHWLWVQGGADVATRHQPHSARSCELALQVVDAARGRPGGVPPAWVWGVRGRALSHPRLPAL